MTGQRLRGGIQGQRKEDARPDYEERTRGGAALRFKILPVFSSPIARASQKLRPSGGIFSRRWPGPTVDPTRTTLTLQCRGLSGQNRVLGISWCLLYYSLIGASQTPVQHPQSRQSLLCPSFSNVVATDLSRQKAKKSSVAASASWFEAPRLPGSSAQGLRVVRIPRSSNLQATRTKKRSSCTQCSASAGASKPVL